MLKDDSLQINSLAFNNCFSYRNVFQNGVNALSKMVFKNPLFCQKAQNFVYFEPYDFVQISRACGPNTYQIMYGETLDLQCQHWQQQHGRIIGVRYCEIYTVICLIDFNPQSE